ncbi:MAG: methyltransferase [Candidatus Schekmanbacteria bacterium]|nr:methyltransferase [Candidatus Schekmanbacteria bacterium]
MPSPDIAPRSDSELGRLRAHFAAAAPEHVDVAAELAVLEARCAGDNARLRRLLKLRLAGEPLAYVIGAQVFRGLEFAVDRRVYLTDPELSYLVDLVIERARALLLALERAPIIVEVGAGSGALAVCVKKAVPHGRLIALEIDAAAAAVAAANFRRHHADVQLIESDLFSSLPEDIQPDLVFSDPPWGDESTTYAPDRPPLHYQAMPKVSVFPRRAPAGVHAEILDGVRARNWTAEVLLNLGVMSEPIASELGRAADRFRLIAPAPGLSVLHCVFARRPP